MAPTIFVMLNVLVALTVSEASSLQQPPSLCSLCNCTSETLLDCDNRKLTEIPSLAGKTKFSLLFFANNRLKRVRQFPEMENVRELVLSRNEIADVDDSAFKNLTRLVALDLSYNRLTSEKLLPRVFRGTVSPDLYEPLRNLVILNIAHNNLHTLDPDLFEHLPYLKHLNLQGNPLNVIGNGLLGAITKIPLLKELNLAKTQLKSLPENCFHDTKFLKTLDLSYNSFVEPPQSLESSHHLEWLSLDGNAFTRIRQFPKLPFLRKLHLNDMPELVSIENRSLSGLPRLEEFACSGNPKLVQIDKNVFSYVNESVGEGEIWPPLKTLVLRNNTLRYIDRHLISRWDHLKRVDLQYNPWMCDCENQWMISTLVPFIEKAQPESLHEFKCGFPNEMENLTFIIMYKRDYEMRCLDTFNHKPENDGKLLVRVFVFVVILAPFLMGAALYYKRYTKISKKHKLKMFLRYSQLDLIPVKNTDYW